MIFIRAWYPHDGPTTPNAITDAHNDADGVEED